MASISERENKDGTITYRVSIRKKGSSLEKSFYTKEDAELYSYYKERLIDNMSNFEVPIKDMVRMEEIIEMKKKSILDSDRRTKNSYDVNLSRFNEFFGKDKFLCNISYDDWVKFAKHLSDLTVYRGAKTEIGARKMSINTLRKVLAEFSSAFSHAISLGINI